MKPKVQGLIYNDHSLLIRELEVSITSKCHLQCDNCGFYIPQQPNPSLNDDVVSEITQGLSLLQRLNIKIGSLGVLGGEPTHNKDVLNRALKEFSKFDNIERIEVVSHGLTPQNIDKEILKFINKLTISVYFESETLIQLWKTYITIIAPHIELSFRRDKEWDKWIGHEIVDDIESQKMFEYCFYRKHCITIERKRLFICSRIPKLSQDQEGLLLNERTTLSNIKEYLNQTTFVPSCKSCTPMMGGTTVKAGLQPDDRILKMLPNAINFITKEINEKP